MQHQDPQLMLDCFINPYQKIANGTVDHRPFYCAVKRTSKFWVFQLSEDGRPPLSIRDNQDGFYRTGRWPDDAGQDEDVEIRIKGIIELCARQYWVEAATWNFRLLVDDNVPLEQPVLAFWEDGTPHVIAKAVVHKNRVVWKMSANGGQVIKPPQFFVPMPKTHGYDKSRFDQAVE